MLSDKIVNYIEERTGWLIGQTVEFIRTAGVSGSEGAVADTLISCLERSGQRAFKDEAGNVVAGFERTEPGGCGQRTLAFNVHLDTVPPVLP
jgi:acetylornithine deacetylase/succinyl-diaminopimelate desuccinylase-like protein